MVLVYGLDSFQLPGWYQKQPGGCKDSRAVLKWELTVSPKYRRRHIKFSEVSLSLWISVASVEMIKYSSSKTFNCTMIGSFKALKHEILA